MKNILLAESGELSLVAEKKLNRHLKHCSRCSEFSGVANGIISDARRELPDGAPRPAVISRIMAAAGKGNVLSVLVFRRPAFRALAAAAVLLVMVGVWTMLLESKVDVGRVRDMNTILDIASIGDIAIDSDYSGDDVSSEKLHLLAERLLIMEGFTSEDHDELDFIAPDV
jgi:hypothetical protein